MAADVAELDRRTTRLVLIGFVTGQPHLRSTRRRDALSCVAWRGGAGSVPAAVRLPSLRRCTEHGR